MSGRARVLPVAPDLHALCTPPNMHGWAHTRTTSTCSTVNPTAQLRTLHRRIANAPVIPPAARAVHPLFLLGTLLAGLPADPSPMVTGTKPRKPKGAAPAYARPAASGPTAEYVAQAVRPALGTTRLSYVAALACGAAEVAWCPGGRFAAAPALHAACAGAPAPRAHDQAPGGAAAAAAQQQVGSPQQQQQPGRGAQQPLVVSVPLPVPAAVPAAVPDQSPATLDVVIPHDLAGKVRAVGPLEE